MSFYSVTKTTVSYKQELVFQTCIVSVTLVCHCLFIKILFEQAENVVDFIDKPRNENLVLYSVFTFSKVIRR